MVSSEAGTARIGGRSRRRGGRRWRGVRIGSGSGRRSLVGCQDRGRVQCEAGVSGPVGFRWFRHAGGVNPCLASDRVGSLPVVRRARGDRAASSAEGWACGRSRVGWGVTRRRSRGSCAATRRRGPASSTTRRRSRSGMPSVALAGRRSRSWSRTSGCASTCRSGCPVRSAMPMAARCSARRGRSGTARTSRTAATGAGCRAGVRSRSRTGSRSTSPMMSPCGSATRRSTRRSTSQSRGALKRELVACLRTGRALRVPRARSTQKAWAHVTPEVMISERPAEVEDRAVPGHWEGDLLIGLERSAIGTLVERTTTVHDADPPAPRGGLRHKHTIKNGPALAGYGAITMKNALAATMTTLPEQLRRSLTWDRGKEMSAHAAVQGRDRHPGLLRRPAKPLAARHEREHQRAAAPVLPQGHRPLPLDRRRDRSRRRDTSTAGRARRSAGRHQPKPSTSSYGRSNKPVLRRSIEPGQYTVTGFTAAGAGHTLDDRRPTSTVERQNVLDHARVDEPTPTQSCPASPTSGVDRRHRRACHPAQHPSMAPRTRSPAGRYRHQKDRSARYRSRR